MIKWTRLTAIYLFWPALAFIVWGELTPAPPHWTADFWDKSLHFTAYFGLAAMAGAAFGWQRRSLWAVLGLIALGAALEILQGFTGRDPDIFDEVANTLGACTGVLSSLGFQRLLLGRRRPVSASSVASSKAVL